MPLPSEFSDRLGKIWRIEVIDEVDAQDLGRAHSHDRAAAEIAVELQAEQQRGHDVKPALVLAFRCIDCRHKQRGAVRHHDFKEVTPDQQQHTVPQVVKGGALGRRKLGQKPVARLMGPETICGKKPTNNAKSSRLCSALSPR